jgi:hypothetical protein
VTLTDGAKTRISGTAPAATNTRTAALDAEREHVERVLKAAVIEAYNYIAPSSGS